MNGIDERIGYCLDWSRSNAYSRMLAHLAPNQTVLDVGTGTGLLAYLAVRHGAKHVHCIERDAKALSLARSLIGDLPNVSFELCDATTYAPPPSDIQIHEILGNFPLDEHIHRIARNLRHLIPNAIELFEYEYECIAETPQEIDRDLYDPYVWEFIERMMYDDLLSIRRRCLKDHVPIGYRESNVLHTIDINADVRTPSASLIDAVNRGAMIGWRVRMGDQSYDNVPRLGNNWRVMRSYGLGNKEFMNRLMGGRGAY